MSNLSCVKVFIILCVVSIFGAEANSIQSSLIHIGQKAELFRQWHRVADNHMMITGPIEYLDQDSELHTKGYRATQTHTLSGEVVREIFDYPKNQSAYNIFAQVQRSLEAHGFEEMFACALDSCGEVDGWKMYLSHLIGDHIQHQYYVAARKIVELDKKVDYVAFYVNEIDGQARSMIDIITEPLHNQFDIAIKGKELLRTLEKDGRVAINGIWFEFDSAVLKKESNSVLKSMSQFLKNNKSTRFAIVGHTDNQGSARYNFNLSKKRASAVRNALIKQFGVSAKQVMAEGVGSMSPLTSNTDKKGMELNRRVELIKL